MRFLIGFLIASFINVPVNADPISREEAQEFLDRVRWSRGLQEDADVQAYAMQELAKAQAILRTYPESQTALVAVGEAHHILGHLAEHDHDFPRARQHHQLSIDAFVQSGLQSRGSELPGDLHAKEHLFMDYYDEGVLKSHQFLTDKVNDFFKQAWAYLQTHKLASQVRADRFVSRHLELHSIMTKQKYVRKDLNFEAGLVGFGSSARGPRDCELILVNLLVEALLRSSGRGSNR